MSIVGEDVCVTKRQGGCQLRQIMCFTEGLFVFRKGECARV